MALPKSVYNNNINLQGLQYTLLLTRSKFKYLPLSVFSTRGGRINIFGLVVKQTVTSSQ